MVKSYKENAEDDGEAADDTTLAELGDDMEGGEEEEPEDDQDVSWGLVFQTSPSLNSLKYLKLISHMFHMSATSISQNHLVWNSVDPKFGCISPSPIHFLIQR